MTLAGKVQKQSLPLKLTFVRPNKIDLETGAVRLVSDGKTMSTAIIPLKRYTTAPAPAAVDVETFRQGPTGAVLFGGPSGAPMFVLLNLLTAPDAAAALGQLGGSLQLAPEDPKAPAPKAPALLIDQEDGPDIRLELDPATKLLNRIEFQDRSRAPCQECTRGPEGLDRAVRVDLRAGLDPGRQGPIPSLTSLPRPSTRSTPSWSSPAPGRAAEVRGE